MGIKFYNTLDIAGLENLASDPVTNLFAGRIYFNTTEQIAKVYSGSGWTDVGSGAGGSSNTLTRIQDIFYETYFAQLSGVDFSVDEDNHVDVSSTGTFDPAGQTFDFGAAAQTLVTTNLLSAADFVGESKIIGRISLVVIWETGEIDTAATYETSLDGALWTPITMTRAGNATDTYLGTYLYTEVLPTANLQVRVTSSAGSVAIKGYGLLYDLESGNTGVFLTRPDGVVRELRINNSDELEIFSI